jgi:hypothetical protein
LKVGITAIAPGSTTTGGYQIGFDCIYYQVTVGSQTQMALVSATGTNQYYGSCAGAKAMPVLDFSNQATAGTSSLSVKITPSTYDNCHQYGYYGVGGCPMNTIYSTNIISGNINIYTNMTVAAPNS